MITLSELASKHNYLTTIPFVFDSNLWEYDISQANINALRAFNRISEEEYIRLANSPKMEREIAIGNKIARDKTIQTDIYRAIGEAKYKFLEESNIDPNRVIRIANDAIYFLSPMNISNTNSKDVFINGNNQMTFRMKGYFTFFMNLKSFNNIILFFFGPGDQYGYDIEVIGINDDKLHLHSHFISFLINIINAYLNGGKISALYQFNNFYNDYVCRRLPVEYYREFNSNSKYRINSNYASYVIEYISQDNVDKIDINHNLNILRTIYSYLIAA